ncbi:MAG: FecR domain-containing protein [Opitutaceae bacterium]
MSRTAPTLDAIDAAAARWIARRDAGLSEAEQAEFARWCEESPLHLEAIARFEGLWATLGRPRRTGVAPVLQSELGHLVGQRRRRRLGITAVACAVLAAIGSWTWLDRPGPTRLVDVAPVAHTTILAPERRELPDGSVVELRSGSELEVNFSGVQRRVLLRRGEAHFAVAKNPDRPFVVTAGGVDVRAVGTVFSVQLGASQVEVLVTEGRVAVETQMPAMVSADPTPAREPLAFVDAGHRLEVDVALQPIAAPEVQPVAENEAAERLAWRAPRVEFSDAPLSEVIATLNRYHATPFMLGDPALAKVSVSGLFRADDTEVFINLLKSGFGIETDLRDGRRVLRKSP